MALVKSSSLFAEKLVRQEGGSGMEIHDIIVLCVILTTMPTSNGHWQKYMQCA